MTLKKSLIAGVMFGALACGTDLTEDQQQRDCAFNAYLAPRLFLRLRGVYDCAVYNPNEGMFDRNLKEHTIGYKCVADLGREVEIDVCETARAEQYDITFGDASTRSEDCLAKYAYQKPGEYVVSVRALNSACEGKSTILGKIVVKAPTTNQEPATGGENEDPPTRIIIKG